LLFLAFKFDLKEAVFGRKLRFLGGENGQKTRFAVTDQLISKNYKPLDVQELKSLDGLKNGLNRVGGWG
jgi:hypothetical protein